jgi:hypothetical protein
MNLHRITKFFAKLEHDKDDREVFKALIMLVMGLTSLFWIIIFTII